MFQVALTNLDTDICKAVLSEYRIHNADINVRYDATVDDLIDVIEGNRFAFQHHVHRKPLCSPQQL